MRLFIAFPVSQDVSSELRQVQAKLKNLNPNTRAKWVGEEGFHATIVFLSEIEIKKLEEIKEIIKQVTDKFGNFEFCLDEINAFPNQQEPRVVVVKLLDYVGRGVLQYAHQIHNELSIALRNIGLEIEDHHWTPHLTLGRNKFTDKIIGFDQVEINKISWTVDKIELIESELSPSGPRYTILESFSLQ